MFLFYLIFISRKHRVLKLQLVYLSCVVYVTIWHGSKSRGVECLTFHRLATNQMHMGSFVVLGSCISGSGVLTTKYGLVKNSCIVIGYSKFPILVYVWMSIGAVGTYRFGDH